MKITTTIAAALIAAVFLGMSVYLLLHFGINTAPSGDWDHTLVIYNAINSVGFTAVGVLLGAQVQQVNVSAAKADAQKKGDTAKAALAALNNVAPGSLDKSLNGDDPISIARGLLLGI